MEASHQQMLNLFELILPKEVLEDFTITNLLIQTKEVHLYLDERSEIPYEYKEEKLISKGFYSEVVIQAMLNSFTPPEMSIDT